MIKNIIFDFGDIFINLDKEIIFKEIEKFGGKTELSNEIVELNHKYEVGAISSEDFISQLHHVYPQATQNEIITIWNSILLDFPDYRLDFLEKLAKSQSYRMFLLSNTNALHIEAVLHKMGADKYNRFKSSFEQFYLSHEIELRKPNTNCFSFVLKENNLVANETLFIDDTKENTDAAAQLGIQCWHLQVGQEDVIELQNKINNA